MQPNLNIKAAINQGLSGHECVRVRVQAYVCMCNTYTYAHITLLQYTINFLTAGSKDDSRL
jgi:hypothetical protein